jgi:hypothetical protein
MRVDDALDRLDAIHAQLDRAEVYRGFRVPAVALVGILGLVAAASQPLVPGAERGIGFVAYWSAVAVAGGLVGTTAGVRSYFLREDAFARRRTRRVLTQFLPAVAAGGAVTAAVTRGAPDLVPFLTGIWAALFGLGVVAAAPFLPPAVGPVGLAYVTLGVILCLRADPAADPSGWAVGGVFGLGHFATALALLQGDRSGKENDDGDA